MPQRPPFVDDVVELSRKLDNLISILQRRVEKGKKDGVSLEPAVQACIQAVSALRAKTLEFETAMDLVASATKLVKELNHLFTRVKQVIEQTGEDDFSRRRAVDNFLYEASLFAAMIRNEVEKPHDSDCRNRRNRS